MKKNEVAELFMRGLDCSQVVAIKFAEECGFSEEEMIRMTAGFGGGLGIGETCGAVAGAMVVLGLKFGPDGPDQDEQKKIMSIKRAEFLKLWREKRQSCVCKELLGHDISIPGELDKVIEEGTMLDFCPELVLDAIDILKKVL